MPNQHTTDTAVRDYVRALLGQDLADTEEFDRFVRGLEEKGRRIISGGQVGQDTWKITDWRTGELLARGADGLDGYDAACDRLDPDGKWLHVDSLDDNWEHTPVELPAGIPESLAEALTDWAGSPSTSDEDIAGFIGWRLEDVARHRE